MRRSYYKELQDMKELADKGIILDLGCRDARDSISFNEAGWKNVIVDKDCVALSQAVVNLKKGCESHCEDLNKFLETDDRSFDIVIANYVLPFLPDYKKSLKRIYSKLKEGGIFIGCFFGDRDAWKDSSKLTFHNKEQALKDLSAYKILDFQEIEESRRLYSGELKDWHIFEFIVKKT